VETSPRADVGFRTDGADAPPALFEPEAPKRREFTLRSTARDEVATSFWFVPDQYFSFGHIDELVDQALLRR
jgi:hypothetical protein